jgi:hypothetical protein
LLASSIAAVVSTASNRAAAVHTRSRPGLLIASLRQRTSVSTPMPTSCETSSNAALSGGSNRATALSLYAWPYRANVCSRRPLLLKQVPGIRAEIGAVTGGGFVDDALRAPAGLPWTTRCVDHRADLRPQASTTSHHYLRP